MHKLIFNFLPFNHTCLNFGLTTDQARLLDGVLLTEIQEECNNKLITQSAQSAQSCSLLANKNIAILLPFAFCSLFNTWPCCGHVLLVRSSYWLLARHVTSLGTASREGSDSSVRFLCPKWLHFSFVRSGARARKCDIAWLQSLQNMVYTWSDAIM